MPDLTPAICKECLNPVWVCECNKPKLVDVVLADKLANEFKATNADFKYDLFMNQAGVLNNPFDPESSAYIAQNH